MLGGLRGQHYAFALAQSVALNQGMGPGRNPFTIRKEVRATFWQLAIRRRERSKFIPFALLMFCDFEIEMNT